MLHANFALSVLQQRSFNVTQAVNLAETWYEATVKRACASVLQNTVRADACVIGGGLAGLTTALELARAGMSVVLLEAGRVGCGASGRNGGFVSNGFALGISDIAHEVGLHNARNLYALSAEGTAYVRNTIETHEPTVMMGSGLRVCVRYDDEKALHRHADRLRADFSETVVASDAATTREILRTQHYFDSIHFPNAFHIHPLRYVLLMQQLCSAAGVRLFEMSRAMSVTKSGTGIVARTARGVVEARHVVHCVSSGDRKLHRMTGRAVLPVATYVAVTAPLEQDAIRTGEAIADTRRAGDYYRLIGERRILWGGRITTRRREPRDLAEKLRADMLSTFPNLGAPRIDYAWSGSMGYALHKMPLIGRDAEGQWFATAFGGHGLNTTAMGGLLIARAIAFGDDAYRAFSAFEPRWVFGILGQLGVQASYWSMQAKDRIDEVRHAKGFS
jgi:gamma-glutamylputrescine oxidase